MVSKKSKTQPRKSVRKNNDNVLVLPTKRHSHANHRPYLIALKEYWEGRPRTALERISSYLTDDTTSLNESLPLYRLWIEILGTQEDERGLQGLAEHFDTMTHENELNQADFYALQGLALLELDSIEGARQSLRQMTREQRLSPYASELAARLQLRFGKADAGKKLHASRSTLRDYFQLETLCEAYLEQGNGEGVRWLLKNSDKLIPGSPLAGLVRIRLFTSINEFAKAKEVCAKLLDAYPGNVDIAFTLGFLNIKVGNLDRAIAEFSRLSSQFNDSDADILAMLGHCLTEKSIQTNDKQLVNRTLEILQRSAKILREQGMPITAPVRDINRLKESFAMHNSELDREPKFWLVKLSDRKFNELKSSDLRQVKTIRRSMGKNAQPGDICFFLGGDYRSSTKTFQGAQAQWRLAAVYVVATEAEWHPFDNFQTELKLVARPEMSIPLDVHEFDKKGAASRGKKDGSDPSAYGLYEIDESGVKSIMDMIEEFADDASGWGEAIEQWRKFA